MIWVKQLTSAGSMILRLLSLRVAHLVPKMEPREKVTLYSLGPTESQVVGYQLGVTQQFLRSFDPVNAKKCPCFERSQIWTSNSIAVLFPWQKAPLFFVGYLGSTKPDPEATAKGMLSVWSLTNPYGPLVTWEYSFFWWCLICWNTQ